MKTETKWTEGYVSEVDYVYEFYNEMGPVSINLAMTLSGFVSPDMESPFRYCELGFGQGVTLNLLAAAFPWAEFWGTDFNPSHVAGARAFAEDAGLGNINLFEDSFSEFMERELPQFDYICLHGVYSWVSRENHRRIIEFIRRSLKPGGIVYVSYNCMPGWCSGLPLRHLLSTHVEAGNGPLTSRLNRGVSFLKQMEEIGATFFQANSGVSSHLRDIEKESPNYLLHEYLNKDFHAKYFTEVAEDFAEAKLSFAGSATISDHVAVLNFGKQELEMIANTEDTGLRQTMTDYMLNNKFRRDIFVKGPKAMTLSEKNEMIMKQCFSLKRLREDVPAKFSCPRGELTLKAEVCDPILDELAQDVRDLRQLMEGKEISKFRVQDVIEALAIFVAMDVAQPALPGSLSEKAVNSAEKINSAIMKFSETSDKIHYLLSPILGSAVHASRIDQLFLRAYLTGEDLAGHVWKLLSDRGDRLIRNGEVVESEKGNMNILGELADEFREKTLRVWRNLGIVGD